MTHPRYRPLRPEDIRPATYLPGMDPDDPLTPKEIAQLRRRRRRRDVLMIQIGLVWLLGILALALIAMAAGWS